MRRRNHRPPRARSVLLATGMLVLGVTGVGVAANGDVLREGQRNGTATRETEIISRTDETGGDKGGYSTRQSNLSRTGGGAIYGCRAAAGDARTNTNPCLRANNLSNGLAFEFNAGSGGVVGTITAGTGGDAKKPLTTNATGVATGFNADEVDGQSADQIVAAARAKAGLDADTVDGAGAEALTTRWALVNEDGEIQAQTGGFSMAGCDQAADNTCYVDAGEDVRDNGVHAQVATVNGQLAAGDTAAAPCGAEFVDCGGAENNQVLAVALSDETPDPTDRFRFYVYVTGSQAG